MQVKRKTRPRRRVSPQSRRKQRLDERRWLSKDQVAKRFGVSQMTVSNWVASGRLPTGVYFSRQVLRWSREVIEQFEANAATTRPAGPPRLPKERTE